jgi:hypothetical protein
MELYKMEKLTETCYINKVKMLSVLQPMDRDDWIVINKKGAIMFGPNNQANCFTFVEKYEG